jgi:hypothetical protein
MIDTNILIHENVNIEMMDELDKSNDEFNLNKLMEDFENISLKNVGIESDQLYTDMLNYDMNYTVKQLLLVCEYYGITKEIKVNKMKKNEIIEQIIIFENNNDNYDAVIRRKELWYYINELKEDKMMKRFIIWS